MCDARSRPVAHGEAAPNVNPEWDFRPAIVGEVGDIRRA
jgi:hypothetical protein